MIWQWETPFQQLSDQSCLHILFYAVNAVCCKVIWESFGQKFVQSFVSVQYEHIFQVCMSLLNNLNTWACLSEHCIEDIP